MMKRLLALGLVCLGSVAGAQTPQRGWEMSARRVILSRSPYHVYYRVSLAAERVIIVAVRHERERPRKL